MGTRGRPRHNDILTPRQWEVLELLRDGRTNAEIAEELDITVDGAKFHVSEILGRLGVTSREEAARTDAAPRGASAYLGARVPRWRAGGPPARLVAAGRPMRPAAGRRVRTARAARDSRKLAA